MRLKGTTASEPGRRNTKSGPDVAVALLVVYATGARSFRRQRRVEATTQRVLVGKDSIASVLGMPDCHRDGKFNSSRSGFISGPGRRKDFALSNPSGWDLVECVRSQARTPAGRRYMHSPSARCALQRFVVQSRRLCSSLWHRFFSRCLTFGRRR
jgi:hypothetical protein